MVLSARTPMALRAAVAAAGPAWAVALLVPGPVADHPYYGPLGAVIATSTIVGSVRESAQAVEAITLGSALRLGAQLSGAPAYTAVPVMVLVGVLVGVLAGPGHVGVNLVSGPLPPGPIADVHHRVRRMLAHQLELIGTGLTDADLPGEQRWRWMTHELEPYAAQLRNDADDGQRAAEVDERLAELRRAVLDAPGDTFHAAAVVTMLDEVRVRL